MTTHWMDLHKEKYQAIRRWLGESDLKVRAAEVLAKEGMKGPGQLSEVPRVTFDPAMRHKKSSAMMGIAGVGISRKPADSYEEMLTLDKLHKIDPEEVEEDIDE